MNEWQWSYNGYDPGEEGQREALCTMGNGHVATRGALAECNANDIHYPGTYLAGVFNRLTTEVAGRDVVNESLVNVPNWLPMRFRTADGEFDIFQNITVADVQRVARTYFRPENRLVLTILPNGKPGGR